MIKLTDNILKVKEMGIYVTYIDGRAYYSPMTGPQSPTLDADGCIDWIPFEFVSEELDVILKENLGGYKKCFTNSNVKNVKK
ncbi:MAG: hypothetical protein ACK419_04240 [Pyrinomonadaceae bacterium]